MLVTILLGLFSILFAYLAKYKNTAWGLKASFTLIFLFLALRYNFGNDYESYFDYFIRVGQNDQLFLFDFVQTYEPGWVLLNWLFRTFGFFSMTAVLALISCSIYYRFIVKYVPVEYYWLAIFIYIFYPGFLLIHSSAMRQSISIGLFVFSLGYLANKNAIRYFFCIGLASLFHFTAIILAPVYLLVFLNQKIREVYGSIFILIYISIFLFGSSIIPYLQLFISNFSEKYEFYQNTGVINTGLSLLYYSTLLIIILLFERMQNREVALVFKVAILSFMFFPLALIIEMTGRIGMYFAPAIIVVYPIIVKSLREPISKTIFLSMLIAITLFQFFQFFYSDTYQDYFINYQTIFSAPQWQ